MSDFRKASNRLIAADPYFSALVKPTTLEWTHLGKAGLENRCEKRAVVVAAHKGSIEGSLACFLRSVLPDVPPITEQVQGIEINDKQENGRLGLTESA